MPTKHVLEKFKHLQNNDIQNFEISLEVSFQHGVFELRCLDHPQSPDVSPFVVQCLFL